MICFFTIADTQIKMYFANDLGLVGDGHTVNYSGIVNMANQINRDRGGEIIFEKEAYRLDFRDADIFNSPASYLAQYEIIYVEPNNTGIQANRRPWCLSLGMTVIGAGLTIYSLFK